MEFGVLGPLQVRHRGEPLPLGTPQQQLVLVLLVLNLGRSVNLEGMIFELWGEQPPPSAVAKVRGYAAALRRLFATVQPGVDRVIRAGSGYLLNVQDAEVDLRQFGQDVDYGRRVLAEGDLPAAQESFERALRRWRGTMLDGLPRGPVIASRCSTVEQDRLVVVDSLAEIHLWHGQPARAIALIWPQVHAEPLREQSYALLMRARYQVEGVAGALEVYETLRRSLADQLGIEPSAELQRLHRAVLNRDSTLELAGPGQAGPPAPPPATPAMLPRPREPAVSPDRTGHRSRLESPGPCTLPPDVPDFVGRGREVDRLRELLTSRVGAGVVVVTIAGPGGVGKTALSVHVAHQLQAEYPDGQIYVDLRGLDRDRAATPYEVLSRLVRLLGDSGRDAESVAELTERYRSLLARRRVVLVLDNVASEQQIRSLVPGGPACAVIAISRVRLGASFGAQLLDLDVLDDTAATSLLARLAGSHRSEAEPGAVLELARLCDRLPLALRIAGGRLATKPHWSVGKLVQLLRAEPTRLDQLRHDHLDLRASIQLSYQGLSQEGQRLFRRLGALDVTEPDGRSSAALLDRSIADAEQVLEQLVDARLVRVTGRDAVDGLRCRLDSLFRLFARERAEREEQPGQLAAALARAFGTRSPHARWPPAVP